MIARIAIPLTFITLVLIGFSRANPADAAAVEAYHDRIAKVVDEIPLDFGGWAGREQPLPQSATSLLSPNAIIARQYVHEEKGVLATLMIVQCRDARDMGGHFPPVCYPANGWTYERADEYNTHEMDGHDLRVYGFSRVAGTSEREISIYSLFALPTGVMTNSMKDVRRLGASYQFRDYGAAQLQIMISGTVPVEDHPWIIEELFEIARPTMEAVLDAGLGVEQDEEGSL